MTKRLFTPTLANRALPLVRRIVADILETGRRFREEEQSSRENDQTSQEPGPSPELKELHQELESYLAELEEIGCSYKAGDFDVGLVDFPAEIEGESVLLCWRSDEPGVSHYHTEDGGYAARKPIPPELFDSPSASPEETAPRETERLGSELD